MTALFKLFQPHKINIHHHVIFIKSYGHTTPS